MKGNILKRIISTILASFICTQSIFAEGMYNVSSVTSINEGQALTTITVGNITGANPGDTIRFPLTISNNGLGTGLTGLHINVKYDKNVLSYVYTSKSRDLEGDALLDLNLQLPGRNFTPGDINFAWENSEPDNTDGVIIYIPFKVADTATSGDYTIEVIVVTAIGYDSADVQVVVSGDLLLSELETENINRNEAASPNFNTTTSETNRIQNLIPVSSDLAIASNIKLNGITVDENGMRIIDDANMSCTISVSNTSTDDNSIIVILATYTNEGLLHHVTPYEIDVKANDTSSKEITYQFDAQKECSGKLMFWNTLTNLIPLRASINFTQDSGINAYYYNADNRLLQIDKANGKTLNFSYDNMGNLLSKTISGGEEDV